MDVVDDLDMPDIPDIKEINQTQIIYLPSDLNLSESLLWLF
jgi:hypothetical protein